MQYWLELEKGELFFEKIAKFHELMGKMDDADFGLALKYVRSLHIYRSIFFLLDLQVL